MSDKSVSVGIHVPSASTTALGSGEAYREVFAHVEAVGLDAVWTEDRIFHAANMLDPLVLLALAAASTRRLALGTAVRVLNLRNAAVVARQVASLQHLSGGRFALGLSVAGRPDEYDGRGPGAPTLTAAGGNFSPSRPTVWCRSRHQGASPALDNRVRNRERGEPGR